MDRLNRDMLFKTLDHWAVEHPCSWYSKTSQEEHLQVMKLETDQVDPSVEFPKNIVSLTCCQAWSLQATNPKAEAHLESKTIKTRALFQKRRKTSSTSTTSSAEVKLHSWVILWNPWISEISQLIILLNKLRRWWEALRFQHLVVPKRILAEISRLVWQMMLHSELRWELRRTELEPLKTVCCQMRFRKITGVSWTIINTNFSLRMKKTRKMKS